MQVGRSVGSFNVLAKVGEGGMGEVYRARDSKLNRDVAIKTLLPAVATDKERLARFSREAQVLASLNHPNIAHIHGLEDGDGGPFLVMEFVEGPTLAERLKTGPLPFDEALAIARQVAEALEAAHERGVIHRDLKPANIKVTDDGTVKILDFGLAKAIDPGAVSGDAGSAANSPTITTPAMTQAGLILGTAAYMSPEQAKGRPVDKRSDVWAFGCVLFEMLTARRAFDGEDVTDTIALVVRGEPDWTALPADTPPQIRLLLKRCLEKDRRARISDIGVARFLMNETVTAVPGPSAVAPIARSRSSVAAAAAIGLVAGVAIIAGAWAWSSQRPAEDVTPIRFLLTPPAEVPLVTQGNDHDLAIAPDASFIVYRSGNADSMQPFLAIRRMDELEPRVLAGTANARYPFISPDGRWVGYQVGGELRKVLISGGSPAVITRVQGASRGASWGDDDHIVFASALNAGIMRVPAAGGEPTQLTKASEAGEIHSYPHVLPGSKAVVFTAMSANDLLSLRLEVVDVASGQQKTMIRGAHDAMYLDDGFLVYAATDVSPNSGARFLGSLLAVPFDVDRLETRGDPVRMIERLAISVTGSANYTLSRKGALAYVAGASAVAGGDALSKRTLTWVDRSGRETPLGAEARAYAMARISPDGTRVALDVREQTNDIWIWDVARKTMATVNRHLAQDMSPLWTPDGTRVIWTSTRAGGNPNLYWQAADGSGSTERLATNQTNQFPTSITADGSTVVIFGASDAPANATDLFTVSLKDGGKSQPLVTAAGFDFGGELSPDGKWLAYHSNESGEFQVYVRPFPNVQAAGRTQISSGGGTRPAWRRDGRELFYLDKEGLLTSVTIQTSANGLVAGTPSTILKERYYAGSTILGLDLRAYDIAPDGQRFLMIKESSDPRVATLSSMTIVLNWAEELKARFR